MFHINGKNPKPQIKQCTLFKTSIVWCSGVNILLIVFFIILGHNFPVKLHEGENKHKKFPNLTDSATWAKHIFLGGILFFEDVFFSLGSLGLIPLKS